LKWTWLAQDARYCARIRPNLNKYLTELWAHNAGDLIMSIRNVRHARHAQALAPLCDLDNRQMLMMGAMIIGIALSSLLLFG
jgi:hypothetical protein